MWSLAASIKNQAPGKEYTVMLCKGGNRAGMLRIESVSASSSFADGGDEDNFLSDSTCHKTRVDQGCIGV